MFRAVAIDLDGTVLDGDGRLSPFAKATLEAVAAAGVHVIPATARPPRSTLPLIGSAQSAVCCNGALVIEGDGGTLHETCFDPDALVRFIAWARSRIPDLGFGVRAHDHLIGNETYLNLRNAARPSGHVVIEHPQQLLRYRSHAASFRASGMTSDSIVGLLRTGMDPELGAFSISAGSVLDVSPRGASKATGLRVLAAHHGFTADETIAYGDMPNDVDMLTWAKIGVAVADAHAEAADAADLQIGRASDDAVARHIRSVLNLD